MISCGEPSGDLYAGALVRELRALDPDVSVPPVVKAVSTDPVLATRVIQLTNSAFSASAKEITTINEAVISPGLGGGPAWKKLPTCVVRSSHVRYL